MLTIDLGTSACKAQVFVGGIAASQAVERLRIRHAQPGWAEQSPDAWWNAVVRTVRRASHRAGGPRFDAIAVSSQSESLVLADADGRALRPSVLWLDQRGGSEATALEDRIGLRRIWDVTGLRMSSTFTAAKVAWVRRHDAESWKRARWLMQPKDFLLFRLTGQSATDPSTASRSAFFALQKGVWWDEMLEVLEIDRERLPRVQPSHTAVGVLRPDAAEELGVASGAVVAAGATDRACEALGVAVTGTRAMVSTGTATNVSIVRPVGERIDNMALITPAHAIPHEKLVSAALPTSGSAFDWLAGILGSTLGERAYGELARAALASPAGANGTTLLPFLMGARSIRWNPEARGVVSGLTLSTTRGDLARALIEGVAFEVRACLSAIELSTGPITEVALLGSANRHVLWAEVTTNVLGRPCWRPADQDSAAAGAMLLATAAIEESPNLLVAANRRLEIANRYDPNPGLHDLYRARSADYESVYRRLWPPLEGAG